MTSDRHAILRPSTAPSRFFSITEAELDAIDRAMRGRTHFVGRVPPTDERLMMEVRALRDALTEAEDCLYAATSCIADPTTAARIIAAYADQIAHIRHDFSTR